MPRPIVLIHGYSDRGKSYETWVQALVANEYDPADIHVLSYESLADEVSVRDIAEAFDSALRRRLPADQHPEFDCVVHSTGMLVIRAWLTSYRGAVANQQRLKHLIALAPATFGSPMAHKGRSFLGAMFKGKAEPGPDFKEAGDAVLDALELGGRFTWDLAHRDLFGAAPVFGPDADSPYVFILCGTSQYGGLYSLVADDPGTDGTVRVSGAGLNCRKFNLDLRGNGQPNVTLQTPSSLDAPVVPLAGLNHGTILRSPNAQALSLVLSALQVGNLAQYQQWYSGIAGLIAAHPDPWQQFIVRAVDERGDGIHDYNLQITAQGRLFVKEFVKDVHVYSADPSYRCFHVPVKDVLAKVNQDQLTVRLFASLNTDKVGYQGAGSPASAAWRAKFPLGASQGTTLFYPNTTTLIELTLNREPLARGEENRVAWFV